MVEAVAGRAVTVAAHASFGGATLEAMTRYARYAKKVGADTLLLSPNQAYIKGPDLSWVVEWTKAAAAIMPVLLHDTGVQTPILDQLHQIGAVVGFKMERMPPRTRSRTLALGTLVEPDRSPTPPPLPGQTPSWTPCRSSSSMARTGR